MKLHIKQFALALVAASFLSLAPLPAEAQDTGEGVESIGVDDSNTPPIPINGIIGGASNSNATDGPDESGQNILPFIIFGFAALVVVVATGVLLASRRRTVPNPLAD
ncbi:hypothetical protein FWH13_03665 [Candidatus Saccharibacteria bacterium]|nr:hypothetical protein [Candidatus Saccharibacteria bacterium]